MSEIQVAEQKLIGILIQHKSVFVEVAEKLKPEAFGNAVYADTFRELREWHLENEGDVELTELIERVQAKRKKPCSVEILTACEEGFTPQSAPWALREVLTASKKRFLDRKLRGVLQKIPAAETVQPLITELLDIATEGFEVTGRVYSGREMAEQIVVRQDKRKSSGDTVEGYRTGFAAVDSHLGGLKPGRTGLLSGAYGQGKTALAANWLVNIAIRARVPSLFASLEMDPSDVQDRLLGIMTDTSVKQITSGAVTTAIVDALQDIASAPIFISDNYPRDVHDLGFMIEKYTRTEGVKLFVLDYVGELSRDPVKWKEDRDERYSRWTKKIRDLAKRLNFHGLILAQVNYQGHLAESKKMVGHADYYLHLDRTQTQRYLVMRKNRFGPRYNRYAIEYNEQTQKMTEKGLMGTEQEE